MSLQIRRGTEAERQVLASPPQEGELIWITDDAKMYIGDGATLLRDLVPVTGFNAEDAADTIGEILQTTSTHQGISFAYNDVAGTINATVELDALRQNVDMNGQDITGSGNIDITGNVTATRFVGDYQGSVSADDSTILVDGVNGKINLNGTVNTDIIPDSNEAYDIGSGAARFRDLYLSGSTIDLGGSTLSRNSSGGINLPANSTIDGGPIGGTGAGGSLNVDIVGDDSTVIVNSSNNTLQGTLTGDLNGSVFGDDSTVLVNGVDSTVRLDNGTVLIDGDVITTNGLELTLGTLAEANSTELQVISIDGTAPFVGIAKAGTNFGNTAFNTMRSLHGADPENPSQATAGDYSGGWTTAVYDTTVSDYIGTVIIAGQVDNNETVSPGVAKGKLVFSTQSGSYSAPSFNYMTFDAQGRLAVGQQDADATVDINGLMKLVPQTSAPSSPPSGSFAVADPASWDPASKGGSDTYPVFFNGTSWVALY
jgi:hypothetical protein